MQDEWTNEMENISETSDISETIWEWSIAYKLQIIFIIIYSYLYLINGPTRFHLYKQPETMNNWSNPSQTIYQSNPIFGKIGAYCINIFLSSSWFEKHLLWNHLKWATKSIMLETGHCKLVHKSFLRLCSSMYGLTCLRKNILSLICTVNGAGIGPGRNKCYWLYYLFFCGRIYCRNNRIM